MKKFSYLFFALALLALACRPSSAAPSSVNVNDCDTTEHSEYLSVVITCNAEVYNEYGNAYSVTFRWNKGRYRDGYSKIQFRAATADMPVSPKDFFNRYIPKSWTGPVSIDVHCRVKLPYENVEITDIYNRIGDTIYFGGAPLEEGFTISNITADPFTLPLIDPAAQMNKFIIVGNNGNVYDFDINNIKGNKNTARLTNELANTKWNVEGLFPLTVYTISISTTRHTISVVSADEAKGMITPGTDPQVNQGEDSSFVVVANDGYRIAKLLIDGEPVAIDSKFLCGYTFKQVEKPHSLEAVFEEYTTAPSASADMGLTATLVDVLESKEDKEVADFETLGFVSGGQNVNIVSADGKTKTGGTFTAGEVGFVQAVKLAVKYEEGAESKGLTLTVKPLDTTKPFSADKSYHALLLNKTTNYYDLYPATLNADGNLTMTIKPVGDYFSTGTIFVYSGTAKETGDDPTPVPEPEAESKSSGGCAAGIGALALLALAPLLDRRKK